jgi:PAS domain S-box-containing protein
MRHPERECGHETEMILLLKEPVSLRIVMCHDPRNRMRGYEKDYLVGKRDHDLFADELASVFEERDRESIQQKTALQNDEELVTRSGGRWQVLTRRIPILDQEKGLVYLLRISTESPAAQPLEPGVTDLLMLQLLLDDSPDLIYFKDLHSRFLRGSKALCEHLRIAPEELPGKSDYDFFAPERVKPHFEEEQEIIRTGRPLIGQMEENIGKDGKPWWVLTSKAAFRDQTGRIIGTFGISKDITDLKNAEAALEQSRRHALELSRKAGMAEIAADILHNAGNVLNSAGVSAETILSQVKQSRVNNLGRVVALLNAQTQNLAEFLSNDPKGKHTLGYLRQLAQFLATEQGALLKEIKTLISHLGTIKQIVAAHRKYKPQAGLRETFNLAALLDGILVSIEESLHQNQVEVLRNDAPDLPLITAERDRVTRVLTNLLRNAEHACAKAGTAHKRITIELTALAGRTRLQVMVTDNGCGLEPDRVPLVFNAECATRRSGFGMGLHDDALFASSIGGTLTARSGGLGKGAAFTLEMPTNGSG